MFGTLHYKPYENEVEFTERPHGSSDIEKYQACDQCKAKKVSSKSMYSTSCNQKGYNYLQVLILLIGQMR